MMTPKSPIMIWPAVMTVFVILVYKMVYLLLEQSEKIGFLIANCQIRRTSRGDFIEMTATVEEVEVSSVTCLDNKQVMPMSSLAGRIPLSDLSRYDRKIK